ncbi:hypothetical protein BDV96DRAFT_576288 [Lophiotrema nucula]|uniref:Glycosyltransferase family 25 protein n=1 Tax=Lophiotrema nucula TaxID=690887 RepID=A0A6A5Z6D4_9PLEO|nr:hypothetical protein BDV96DRAFT_576288 [Lophiotrema nucula]
MFLPLPTSDKLGVLEPFICIDTMRALQGIRTSQVLVASIVILTVFFTVSRFAPERFSTNPLGGNVRNSTQNSKTSPYFNWQNPPEAQPANATLDFQEIIYLSMPYRTDRQDALSLIAAASGLKLTMIPGVSNDDVHPKAMPANNGPHDFTKKAWLGVWRAHANVWRYIIDNDVQSALIIEDDVDWDVNIKDIMGNLNWQLRYNNTVRWGQDNVQQGWDEECAYGCDWDDIFLGQCGGNPNPNRLDLMSVIPDKDGPKLRDIHKNWQKEFTEMWNLTESEGVRVVSPTYDPICLQAYAVTRMGAMRLLYHIGGWKPFGNPVDNEVAWRNVEGKVSGYTLSPPAFVPWKLGGAQDSDNNPEVKAQKLSNKGQTGGESVGLKNSVRKSLAKLFQKNYWQDREDELR